MNEYLSHMAFFEQEWCRSQNSSIHQVRVVLAVKWQKPSDQSDLYQILLYCTIQLSENKALDLCAASDLFSNSE